MKKAKETIRLDHLTIGYRTNGNDAAVATDICATIREGELTCLLGANGVGKSTLLRTMAAFQPRLSGHIYVAETELDDYSDSRLARTIGVVLTDKPDVHNMTVRQMVAMGRSPYTGFWGRCSAADMEIVDEAIALTGITAIAGRMVGTLSDGERQKVMIAKALAQQTPVIILDEPTAFLDYPSKIETMQLLHRISHEMGKTIFLSTHDVELALQIADTVWLMSRSGVTTGTPEDLALNGLLPAFFENSSITFDAMTGLFALNHTPDRRARLSVAAGVDVDGRRAAMVRKALLRNGISTEECSHQNEPADIHITITADAYSFNGVSVQTIEEIIYLAC